MKKTKISKSLLALAVTSLASLVSCGAGISEHEHVYDSGEVTTAATCAATGVRTYHCTVEGCTNTKTETINKTTEHTYGSPVVTDPTCTEGGYTERTCGTCGHVEHVDGEPATGHTPRTWTTTEEATLTSKGSKSTTCDGCGAPMTDEIDYATEAFKTSYESDFHADTVGNGRWGYGYTTTYFEGEEGVYDLVDLELNGAKDEWMKDGVSVNIKDTWIKADGAMAVTTYYNTNGVNRLHFGIDFTGANGDTRMILRATVRTADGELIGNPIWLGNDYESNWYKEVDVILEKGQQINFLFDGAGSGPKDGSFHINVEENVADLKNDFSIDTNNGWNYYGVNGYDCGNRPLVGTPLDVNNEWKEWNSNECIIKKDNDGIWLKTSYDDKDGGKACAAVAYTVGEMNITSLKVSLVFAGDRDDSRTAARLFVLNSEGAYKEINNGGNHYFFGGDFSGYWTGSATVNVEEGDQIYVVYTPENGTDENRSAGHVTVRVSAGE